MHGLGHYEFNVGAALGKLLNKNTRTVPRARINQEAKILGVKDRLIDDSCIAQLMFALGLHECWR